MTTHMNLFTYGSLTYPQVLEALTEQTFSFEDLGLPGFERSAIIDKMYHGIRENPLEAVDGRLWFNVSDHAMRILDRFEDPLYERRSIEVFTGTRGKIVARAYVVPRELEHTLTLTAWDW